MIKYIKKMNQITFLFIFKSSISKNLFFQQRITDIEKAQVKEESLSLLKSYNDLFI